MINIATGKRHLFIAAVFFALLLVGHIFSQPAFSQPTTALTIEFYEVAGTTASEIRNELNRHSPINVHSRKYDAFTQWHVTWTIKYMVHNSRCSISEVATKLKISQILPKLTANTNSSLQKKWDSYMAALLHHENGHRRIGTLAAHAIENGLYNLGHAADCKILDQKANVLSNKIINEHIALENEYDRITDHGANEGAVFP